MVLKFFGILFVALIPAAQAGDGLRLIGNEKDLRACQKLAMSFLDELRGIAGEEQIEIDLAADTTKTFSGKSFTISCDQKSQTVHLRNEEDRFSFQYFEKSKGFSAQDWLVFQRDVLNAPLELKSLAPVPHVPETTALATTDAPSRLSPWLYGAGAAVVLGAVASAAYFLFRQDQKGPTVDVQ